MVDVRWHGVLGVEGTVTYRVEVGGIGTGKSHAVHRTHCLCPWNSRVSTGRGRLRDRTCGVDTSSRTLAHLLLLSAKEFLESVFVPPSGRRRLPLGTSFQGRWHRLAGGWRGISYLLFGPL